jgi:hypothetical protein
MSSRRDLAAGMLLVPILLVAARAQGRRLIVALMTPVCRCTGGTAARLSGTRCTARATGMVGTATFWDTADGT